MSRLRIILVSLLAIILLVVLATSSTGASTEPKGSPWRGAGIWVWYVKGEPEQLVARLQRLRVNTVFIKSADGRSSWKQFSPELVKTIRAAGIHVCGWQYVYGNYPLGEARAAAKAKAAGADCFVIDAEREYEENKRYQARVYLKELRRLVGKDYQLGFTSFPYVNLHPKMPYDIFLGRGGAQANLPQMYWKEIGESARDTLYGSWNQNLAFKRHVYPIGQAYNRPRGEDVRYFSRKLKSVDARGISWWSLDHLDSKTEAVLRQEHKRWR